MKNIIIFGSGDNARMIFSELIVNKEYKILGFIGKSEKKKIIEKFKNKNYYNLGSVNENKKILDKACGVIGIGDNYIRSKVYKEIIKFNENFSWETIISKSAIINENVLIGSGTVIMPNVTINFGSRIERHCLINTSTSIDHDNLFKDFSSTGPGVTTAGRVLVGNFSHIGVGAVIQNHCKIGKNTVIGANSLVNNNCFDNGIYYGSPAKKIRNRTKDDKYL